MATLVADPCHGGYFLLTATVFLLSPSQDEFIRKYEGLESETLEDFLAKFGSTEGELKATINYLIRHRELMKNAELEKLETQIKTLLEKLRDLKMKKLLEEIECFKEILALQKRLLQKDDKPGN